MVDRYIHSDQVKSSPESSGVILFPNRTEERAGGAGNVVMNLVALGAKVHPIGMLGMDQYSTTIRKIFADARIDHQNVLSHQNRITTVKTRYYHKTKQLFRTDEEDTSAIEEELETQIVEKYRNLIKTTDIDALILQDYNKGLLTGRVIEGILYYSQKCGVQVFVDPKFTNFYRYDSVFLFKPNLVECERALNKKITVDLEGLTKASKEIQERNQAQNVVITLSDKGIYGMNSDTKVLLPSLIIPHPDVCGAGDSVISVLALSLLIGNNLSESCRLANIAGYLTCSKMGAAPVLLREIEEIRASLI